MFILFEIILFVVEMQRILISFFINSLILLINSYYVLV